MIRNLMVVAADVSAMCINVSEQNSGCRSVTIRYRPISGTRRSRKTCGATGGCKADYPTVMDYYGEENGITADDYKSAQLLHRCQ